MKRENLLKKNPSKKIVLLSLSALLLVLVVAVPTIMLLPRQSDLPDAIRFSKEYVLVEEDNAFVYKSVSQVADILENGTGIVILGFRECIWCQTYVAILHEVAKDLGVVEIYYSDIRTDREINSIPYQRIVKALDEHLELDTEGRPRVFVPAFTVVKDGVIIGHDNETSTLSDISPVDYWTNSKVDALKQRMEAMIKEIL